MRKLFVAAGASFVVALVTMVACSSSSSESGGGGADAAAASDRLVIDLDAILAEAMAGFDVGVIDASTHFVEGGCGTAAGQMTKTAPTANLCANGATPQVSGGGALYTWICPVAGSSDMSLCNAPQELTITVDAADGGVVSPMTKEVGWGSSGHMFTVTPNAGHSASASGCSGTLLGTQYQTGQITAACTITVTFP